MVPIAIFIIILLTVETIENGGVLYAIQFHHFLPRLQFVMKTGASIAKSQFCI